jgi:hypothetical protein
MSNEETAHIDFLELQQRMKDAEIKQLKEQLESAKKVGKAACQLLEQEQTKSGKLQADLSEAERLLGDARVALDDAGWEYIPDKIEAFLARLKEKRDGHNLGTGEKGGTVSD